jgi:hypothetical protein
MEYPMKKIILTLALILASSSLVVGMPSIDANAGARKICKQGLKTHPMAGEHRDLMKQCKAAYKAHMKAGYPRPK